MGMLLYMMEQSMKNNTAAGATEKVAPKPPHIAEATPEVKEEKKKVTRQDVMKMNVATVRAYAKEQGIADADEKSGAELKRILCDKMFDESE